MNGPRGDGVLLTRVMIMTTKHLVLVVSVLLSFALAGCGVDTFTGDDSGNPPDASPSGDAADDHKTGVKLDGGADADPGTDSGSDATDDSADSDASDGGTTTLGPKRVFTTATTEYYIGTGTNHFQGLAGADAICQSRANGANLGGTWKAWLSSSTQSASQRLTHTGSPYQLVDGTVVAFDWTELTSGTLAHRIDENETSQQWTSAVHWTSTSAGGGALTSTCSDWTSNSASMPVEYGDNSYLDSRWTDIMPTTCADHMSLYCIEQ